MNKPIFAGITSNVANSPIRRERLQGRDYLVAPLTMLTEGVHNGSGGPVLYTGDEMGKFPEAWNTKPVVVYHPQQNGQGVSACAPAMLETHQVGMVMNTRYSGTLGAEAWLEEHRCKAVDERVLAHLESNTVMEISTGLFTENTPAPDGATWAGKPYSFIAHNFRPDHLALLPDKVGACSVADGCGMLRLNEAATAAGLRLDAILGGGLDYARRIIGNAMSHDDMHRKLRDLLAPPAGPGAEFVEFWIEDVYPTEVVYRLGTILYRVGYTVAKGVVTLAGTPEPVERVVSYKAIVANNATDAVREYLANAYARKFS